ncbi:hypothetical protein SBOR_0849 [Sclerotinia borealis F-4128]|uniref:Clr5 domain-containing protein n=1 Tax=Sclerotinia borealis (strain F-4128) TaxID=1432307 RepID=W9CRM7_SCLBF|nr:hypothetical protein SBOR_0849 [Sclerotinia borealis F-4128]
MERPRIEYTVEQLINLHRYWITEQFYTDKRSEEEILKLLHLRDINVTLETLHSYLTNWGLYTPRPYDPEDWIIVPNADQLYSFQEKDDYSIVSATSSQLVPESHKQMPPPILSTAILPTSTIMLSKPTTICSSVNPSLISISLPPQPVLKGLDTIPNGLTPLEFYSLDLQDHERRAVDLESPRELWRRIKGKKKPPQKTSLRARVLRGPSVLLQ